LTRYTAADLRKHSSYELLQSSIFPSIYKVTNNAGGSHFATRLHCPLPSPTTAGH